SRGVENIHSLSWSSDGHRLAFVADGRSGNRRVHRAAFVADLDNGGTFVAYAGPDSDGLGNFHKAEVLAMSSRPASEDLAILIAYTGDPTVSAPLKVATVRSDGSGVAMLGRDGRCACAGWAPDLEWSPDGTTLAVYSQRDHDRSSTDG